MRAYVGIGGGTSDVSACGCARAGEANAERRLNAAWYYVFSVELGGAARGGRSTGHCFSGKVLIAS